MHCLVYVVLHRRCCIHKSAMCFVVRFHSRIRCLWEGKVRRRPAYVGGECSVKNQGKEWQLLCGRVADVVLSMSGLSVEH